MPSELRGMVRGLILGESDLEVESPVFNDMVAPLRHNSASSVVDAMHRVGTRGNIPVATGVDPQQLAAAAYEFHTRAGTLTDGVCIAIEDLKNGTQVLLFAHQPNLFMSLKVFVSFTLLESIRLMTKARYAEDAVNVFLIVDQDDCDDKRFRVARFPDVARRDGAVPLSAKVGKKGTPMWRTAKPSPETVSEWLGKIKQSAEQALSLARRGMRPASYRSLKLLVQHNLSLIERITWEALAVSRSLSELNSIVVSKLVNETFQASTVFLPAHAIQHTLFPGLKWLIDKQDDLNTAIRAAAAELAHRGYESAFARAHQNDTQVWYFCDTCNARCPLHVVGDQLLLFDLEKHCRCRTRGKSVARTDIDLLRPNLVPKVISDDLLDVISLGKAAGVGYVGQVEHNLIANYVAKCLDVYSPPQILASPTWTNVGLAEIAYYFSNSASRTTLHGAEAALRLSSRGDASIIYYLLSRDADQFRHDWITYFVTGGSPLGVRTEVSGQEVAPEIDIADFLHSINSLVGKYDN